jgi:thioredoxin type arsenate reductase
LGSGGAWQSFGLEALLTFFLMFVIMAMATDTRAVGQAAALAIGSTVALEALFAGPISGASMNPARSFGPALISGTWSGQWVYLTAPFLGAIIGALVYRWLREAGKLPPHHVIQEEIMTESAHSETQSMRVLFLCTHNSSRSQMAEGLLAVRGGPTYQVFSAGTEPRVVHPLAIKVMRELGIDISDHSAKGIEMFADEPPMDLVVTVCNEAAEVCPFFPNARRQVHWGFPDPSRVEGSEEERLAAFRHIRDLIATRINQFLDLHPSTSLEHLYTAAKAQEEQG